MPRAYPRYLSFEEVRERGILRLVNENVLWEQGLALGIQAPVENGVVNFGSPAARFFIADYGKPVTMEDLMLEEITHDG